MRLSVQTDYALRTLMFLAASEDRHSIAEISQKYRISKNHMMKVAQKLAPEGFINSTRERSGGLKLAKPAEQLNVRHIVDSMENTSGFVECFDPKTNQCAVTDVCGLRHALAGAVEAFNAHLEQFTIADLVTDRASFNLLFDATDN
ncbi:MAG: Rrf2 family transcriptional regulator [Parasphingorhabdus sp.]